MALQAFLPSTKCFTLLSSPIPQKHSQFFRNKIIRESDRPLSIYNIATTAKRSQMWRQHLKAPLSSSDASNVAVSDVEEEKMEDSQRPLEIFTPSPWSNFEIFSSNLLSSSELELYNREIGFLKKEVNAMLLATTASGDVAETVRVIDVIARLGLSYHFEEDIEILLNQMFESGEATDALLHTRDLFTVATIFRVFRQHGFEMSCDVFEKFKGEDGTFDETLSSDARGLVSMYEAAFLSLPNEEILDEALHFSTLHLKSFLDSSLSALPPHLRSHIANALRISLHKEIPRYGVHQFITFYEQDSPSSKNDGEEEDKERLLRLAKMDYNRLQDLYRQEICECMRWWEKYVSKYPYARNRLVKMYVCALTDYYEPYYSRARIIATKLFMIYFVLDDTYDSYGTPMELECFTTQIQRWSLEAIDGVPDCMKSLYVDLLSIFDELNEELTNDKQTYCDGALSYVIDAVKEMCGEFMVSKRTLHERQVPTLDEYLRYRIVDVGGGAAESTAFLGMQKYLDDFNPFMWLQTKPQLQTYVFTICSIKDDIASNLYEDMALQVPVISAIECYLKQHECTRDKAVKNLEKICEEAWRDINKECMKLRIAKVPRRYVTILVNHARMMEVFFKDGEGVRRPDLYMVDYMNKLFFDRFLVTIN